MSEVEVSLRRARGRTTWALTGDPVVLKFPGPLFETAYWNVGSYPGTIPAPELDELVVRDGLMTVVIKGPDDQEERYVVNRVKMNYPLPNVCCMFNELPDIESPTAWSEWHIYVGGNKIVVERQPLTVVAP